MPGVSIQVILESGYREKERGDGKNQEKSFIEFKLGLAFSSNWGYRNAW
jgi:hypothetical protein